MSEITNLKITIIKMCDFYVKNAQFSISFKYKQKTTKYLAFQKCYVYTD